jgi:alginate O-acetyltransferase complex protein AlgJ
MRSDRGARRRPPALRAVTAVLAAGVIGAPAIAFMLGERGKPIENREPAAFTGLGDRWDSLESFGKYIGDRLPLRQRAVGEDGWVDEEIFAEDPAFGGSATPQVITGKHGFLFLAEAFDAACAPPLPAAETAEHLAFLASIIRASGRPVLTMVAPDKSSVHPELIPADFVKRGCAERSSNALWTTLDQAAIPGFIDLRQLLRAESARTGDSLYLRTDSHWDEEGARVAVREGVNFFAPGLFDEGEVAYVGQKAYIGDLTNLRGDPTADAEPDYETSRPGITAVSDEVIDDLGARIDHHFVNAGPADRLIQGKTVMFIDSYGSVAQDLLVPYFADLTIIDINTFDQARFAELIADADQVWILSVERSTSARMANEIGSTQFLAYLHDHLPSVAG